MTKLTSIHSLNGPKAETDRLTFKCLVRLTALRYTDLSNSCLEKPPLHSGKKETDSATKLHRITRSIAKNPTFNNSFNFKEVKFWKTLSLRVSKRSVRRVEAPMFARGDVPDLLEEEEVKVPKESWDRRVQVGSKELWDHPA